MRLYELRNYGIGIYRLEICGFGMGGVKLVSIGKV